jgi:hypothetical protein
MEVLGVRLMLGSYPGTQGEVKFAWAGIRSGSRG